METGAMLHLQNRIKLLGTRALALREKDLDIREKTANWDIVTVADKHIEAGLTEYVQTFFPGDGIRGEEGAVRESRSGYEWIFDPIDGTTNYAAGLPFFAISVGRLKDGVPDAGVAYFPAMNEMVAAVRGQGTFLNGMLIGTRPFKGGLRDSVIAAGLSAEHTEMFPLLRSRCRNVLAFGSCVFESARVFLDRGLAAYIHTGAAPFDLAAVTLLVEETGCLVACLDAGHIDFGRPKIPIAVAKNERILDELRELWRAFVTIDE